MRAAVVSSAERVVPLTSLGLVTNHFALPGDGILRNQIYSNATGLPQAAQAFTTSGLMPITDVMRTNGFSYSLDGAAPNWLTNGARVNFYNAATASGHFISSVISGVTVSADLRTITVSAASIPATATHFATNLKWAQGVVTLVYSATNVIPAGAEVDLATKIMVNSGVAAVCLSDPGASGTAESVTAAPVLALGEFIVARQGFTTYDRKPWKGGTHLVQRTNTSPESHDYNNTYQFNSVVTIPDTTPAPSTPGAFATGFSATGANASTIAVQSDCHPAYKLNGMFMGGKHGVLSSYITATAHGKTNIDRGSIWSRSGVNYMLTGVYDSGHLFFTALNTGTATKWAINGTTITSGTMIHVSGATNTGNVTITAGLLAYLNPGTQVLANRTWLEGARPLANGAYAAKLRIQDFSYNIPNAAAVLDYVAGNVGSTSDLNYNSPAIAMQVRRGFRWIDDAWSQTVFDEVAALQNYFCNSSWPTQFQEINSRASASETLWFLTPATKTNAAATTGVPGSHNNGSPLNFSTWQNITANVKEYYDDSTTWADASFWSDGIQRPAWLSAYGVKDSGGNWLRKFVTARSRLVGWTASGVPSISNFLSGANKHYTQTRYNEDVTVGDTRMVVAGSGWTDPAFDTSADINFAFPLGGGQYEWNWWAAGPVTSYTVPIPPALAGKQIAVACRSAGCTVVINPDRTVTVTTTAQGQGFVASAA